MSLPVAPPSRRPGPLRRLRWAAEALLDHGFALRESGRATPMGRGRLLQRFLVRGRVLVLLLDADDLVVVPWIVASGRFEPEVTAFFARILRPDDHCLDIGAYGGYYACLFGRLCPQGRVLALEPLPASFALLRDNLALNSLLDRAEALPCAAAAAPAERVLHRRVGRAGNSSLTAPAPDFLTLLGEPPAEPLTVPAQPVDALAARLGGRVDVMKLDVEGAEPEVIAGAAATLAANPGLQLVMEWSPVQMRAAGHDLGDFLDRLAALGFGAWTLDPRARPLGRDALLALPYTHGILLARAPRWH
jgi:FkbM family methyltransferase